MKAKKASGTAKNGKARKGVVRKALGFVAKHPRTAAGAAGVVAAGVGAYALLRRGKKAVKKAGAKVAKRARRVRAAGKPSAN